MRKEAALSYRAYLVRCWRDPSTLDEERPWRYSVEEVLHERRRKAFGNLEGLIAFLRDELAGKRDESVGNPHDKPRTEVPMP